MLLSAVYSQIKITDPRKRKFYTRFLIVGGLICALIGAVIRYLPQLNKERGFYSFLAMTAVLITTALYLFLQIPPLRKLLSNKKSQLYAALELTSVALMTLTYCYYYLAGIFLQTLEFKPYGVDTINTDIVLRFIGWVSGLIILALIALAIYNTGTRLGKSSRFYIVIALLINSFTQLIEILQRLYALRIIPRNRTLFATISFVVNNNRAFIYAVMAVICLIPLQLYLQNRVLTGVYDNPAELRKRKATMRSARRWATLVICLFVVAISTLSIVKKIYEREIPLSPPEEYQLTDKQARIPLELLDDMHLHRFEWQEPGGNMIRFIALQKAPNSYSVCFDACEICGASGYYERGDEVVCKLCDVVMNRGTIGFPGGCNPIPLAFEITDRYITVELSDLAAESSRFR